MSMMTELLQPAMDTLSMIMVNKVERGNILLLFPILLAACWWDRVRTHKRKREWLRLDPWEQVRRQRIANMTGRRHEQYPL